MSFVTTFIVKMSKSWPLLVFVSLKYCAKKMLLKTHVAFFSCFFGIWLKIQMAESQWAKCSNGQNWPKLEHKTGFSQFHRIIVGLRREYRAVVKLSWIFFQEK
jgi:hypothetical protein